MKKQLNLNLSTKKYSPIILSSIASIGVVATTISAVKVTPKAVKLIQQDSKEKHNGDPNAYTKTEAFKSAWKCYISTGLFAGSTIACIIGACALSQHQQAALISAYALVQNSYKEYKGKLKELYGEGAHNAIVNSIVSEKVKNTSISAVGGWYNTSLDFGSSDNPEIIRTFYDSFSDRYFETTVEKVIQAEYHLNRNFMLNGVISLNDFYDFLGLEKSDFGETVGWSSVDGDIYWIDFNHHKITLDDGMEIFVIEMVFEPTTDWLEDV